MVGAQPRRSCLFSIPCSGEDEWSGGREPRVQRRRLSVCLSVCLRALPVQCTPVRVQDACLLIARLAPGCLTSRWGMAREKRAKTKKAWFFALELLPGRACKLPSQAPTLGGNATRPRGQGAACDGRYDAWTLMAICYALYWKPAVSARSCLLHTIDCLPASPP
ncbi:hypothetical protein LY76DRAFT_123885 [Colletotrichum caudatum]|nr:hypothetical protein LY76DRAFT_123885 [Colletotrichum caudatum]